jgi:uncharacterized membrane protein
MSENSIKSESHIDAIVRQEEEALERRSSSERLVDGVGAFAGSLVFVVLHLVFLIGWLLVNSGKIPTARPFDPYPFSLLGVIVAMEAVVLSSFILMRQNRMMRRGERRDHLNLQVDLLAEKEITKVLQMVRAICGHMGQWPSHFHVCRAARGLRLRRLARLKTTPQPGCGPFGIAEEGSSRRRTWPSLFPPRSVVQKERPDIGHGQSSFSSLWTAA